MTDLDRQLLEEGKRALTPTPAERGALRARIDRAIASTPAPSSGLTTTHGATILGLAVLAGLGLAGLGASIAWPRDTSEPPANVTHETEAAAPIDEPIDAVAEAPPPENPAERAPEIAPEIDAEHAPETPEARAEGPTSVPPRERGTLDAELRLLGEARRALSRGLAREALDALSAHERSFPNGVLREEREALFVRALCEASEPAEARRRLSVFEREHPASVALPALRETCAVAPATE